ncbi:unnamed protein product [marine sediment metagenome]|uniref:Uncharacterized protein n=1 Tax=marine sediment metagenome TaxID=412755 RepID=X1Q2D1_9ZZZZ
MVYPWLGLCEIRFITRQIQGGTPYSVGSVLCYTTIFVGFTVHLEELRWDENIFSDDGPTVCGLWYWRYNSVEISEVTAPVGPTCGADTLPYVHYRYYVSDMWQSEGDHSKFRGLALWRCVYF